MNALAALEEGALVDVLASLVRTPSVNPGTSERAMAERVAGWLEGIAELSFVETLPGRPSLAAVLRGARDGPRLVLNGHMDTVPPGERDSWTTDPFGAELRDGRLYGRGACDMKAGLAAQIAVAHALAPRRGQLAGSLVLHFAAGEEAAEPGTLSLLEAGFTGDLGITTEPTSLRVAIAERGAAFLRVRLIGRSAHGGRPETGVNPIERLPAALAAIEEYAADIGLRTHPLLPPASCTPTVVVAGEKENQVPDVCELRLDRRLLPGEQVDEELGVLRARLLEALADDPAEVGVEVGALERAFAPAEIGADSPFAARVAATAARLAGSPTELIGTAYASDVRNLVNDAGMEAVTFGPGSIDTAHAPDEYVPVAELRDAARVLTAVAEEVLIPE